MTTASRQVSKSMLTIAFWNLGAASSEETARSPRAQRLQQTVANLAQHHAVDMLILAEVPTAASTLLKKLNSLSAASFLNFRKPDPLSQCERIVILHRFPGRYLRTVEESGHYSARLLSLPGRPTVLLFALHLPSKRFRSDESQSFSLTTISGNIRRLEDRLGLRRTVLVGDLNTNPFEPGVVAAEGLNAAMSRDTALLLERTMSFIRRVIRATSPLAPATTQRRNRAGIFGTCLIRSCFDQSCCPISRIETCESW